MSTYLQICQKVNTLAGMQGTMSVATTATGYQATIAEIVSNAWLDIQNLRPEWNFQRTVEDIALTAGTTDYSLTALDLAYDLSRWRKFMILYDDTPLTQYTYDGYIRQKVDENTASTPSIFAVDPVDKHLYFNPLDASYTVSVHYYRQAYTFAADGDTPALPAENHIAITYRAVADYALFLGNTTLYQLYTQKANAAVGSLMRNCNPHKRVRSRGIV